MGIATLLILVWTLCLSIGLTMGRYMTAGSAAVVFTSRMSQVHVTVGEWTDLKTLNIQASNYTEADVVADEDITLRVRAYVKNTLTGTESPVPNPGNLILRIKSSTDDTTYTTEYKAKLFKSVDSATYLGKTSGAGWMYVFLDENGNELTYVLEKDKQSDFYFEITVDDDNFPINTQDIELKIETVRAE
jgi:hypothetical protein